MRLKVGTSNLGVGIISTKTVLKYAELPAYKELGVMPHKGAVDSPVESHNFWWIIPM